MGMDAYGQIHIGIVVPREALYSQGEPILRCTGLYKHEYKKGGKFCPDCGSSFKKGHRLEHTKLHETLLAERLLNICSIADQENSKPEQYFIGVRLSSTSSCRHGEVPHDIITMATFQEMRVQVQSVLDEHGLGEAVILNFLSINY